MVTGVASTEAILTSVMAKVHEICLDAFDFKLFKIMCLDVVVEVVGLEETAKGGGAMGMLAASQLLSTIRMACLELLQ